jgi:hypothetical protein
LPDSVPIADIDDNRTSDIGYFITSNIQHLPPIIQLFPVLGGILITTNQDVYSQVIGKYADLHIPVILCSSLTEARKTARRKKLRLMIYTSFHLLYCGPAVQIFHGGLSDKRYLESARLISYDLVLFPGQKAVDKVRLATTLSWIKNWKLVGYPKFDPYINQQSVRPEYFENKRKTILYAPTWVSEVTRMKPGQRSLYGESSLTRWSVELIRQLAPEYNLIFKFHSRLLSGKLDIYEKIDLAISEGDFHRVVKTVVDDNILPYMEASDLMISDISSVSYEWLHFDKPILFANPAPGQYRKGQVITDNTYVWQAGEVIDRTEDIKPLVDDALQNDGKRDIRNELFRYAIFQADGRATERQVAAILDLYESIRSQPWWKLYLDSAISQRLKRLLAGVFRYSKNIPR